MAQVVCRMRKLKSAGEVGAAGAHNHRPGGGYGHVDPAAPKPIRLVGSGDLVEQVKTRIGDRAIRKNAVLAVEFILSASPDYFRPDDPSAWGKYDQGRLDAWVDSQRKWLVDQFGQDNVVDLALHLDEATPHLHAVIVPIRETDNKLAAAHWFDGPAKLRKLQDSAAAAVAHLGIERGEAFSVADHTTLADYYRDAGKPPPAVPVVKTKPPAPLPPPTLAERLPVGEAAAARREAEAKAKAQAEKRAAEVAAQNKAIRQNYTTAIEQAKGARSAGKRADTAEAKAAAYRAQNEALKAETARMRDIPLPEALERLYGAQEASDSKPNYKTRKFELAGSKIALTGDKWFDNGAGVGGVGAINLVKHLSATDFKGALALLRDSYGDAAEAAVRAEGVRVAEKMAAQVPADLPPPLPEPSAGRWKPVREWLTSARKIPGRLVDELAAAGRIFANRFAGCVFARDRGGFAVRGIGESTFKQTVGKAEACGGFTLPGPGDVWIVEGPVDALSVKSAHADAHVIATLGATGMSAAQVAREAPTGRTVLIALDNDEAGQQRRLVLQKAMLPTHHTIGFRKPAGKDWNDDLRSGRLPVDPHWTPPTGGDGGGDKPRPASKPSSGPRFG